MAGRSCVSVLTVVFILSCNVRADEPKATVGKLAVVIPAGPKGPNYFPDEQISFLGRDPTRFLMVSGNSTVLMQGNSIATATVRKTVLAPGQKTDFDNGYAGITSAVRHPDAKGKLLAFYHAEDHVDMPRVVYNPDIQGAYWSIGLAVSTDNGETFKKVGRVLAASVAKKDVTKEHQGIGDPHVILDASGKYLLAYYTDITRRKGDEPTRIGLARCALADGGEPGKWFKYRNGEFTEKGLGGDESAVVRGPSGFPSECGAPHVTYVAKWKRYVMVFNVLAYKDFENGKAEKGGLYWCLSEDGLKWSDPQLLCTGLPVPLKDKEYVAHPTLALENVTDTKADGQLYFAYSPRWGTKAPGVPHHLARRPITITK